MVACSGDCPLRSWTVLILAYHRVEPAGSDTLSVSCANFERQLRLLRLMGWRPEAVSGGSAGDRTFAVTFDDGYMDSYEYAAPILRRLNVPATFFISTGFVDAQEVYPWRAARIQPDDHLALPMTRQQLEGLVRWGFELGSHTVTHPHLTELSDDSVLNELRESTRFLESLAGSACTKLAYPFGSLNNRIVDLVRRAGFQAAFVTPVRPGVPNEALTRHRIGVYRHDSLVTFALKVSPLYQRGLRRAIWAAKSLAVGPS